MINTIKNGTNMQKPRFSIILPIHNQENHLEDIVNSYSASLKKVKNDWELLLVVNGSDDKSNKKAMELSAKFANITAYNLKEKGWGRAIKFGISKARGGYICYTNSARTNVDDLVKIIKYALINKDALVKATRIVRDGWLRKLGSILFNLEGRLLLKIPVWDINGTPKAFPKKILKKIELTSDNDLIDAELMAKCLKHSIPVIEIPVYFNKRISGKSTTNLISAFKMYMGLLQIKNKI